MANFIRRSKSGSDWSSNDLLAYNITVVERDEQQFFGGPLPAYTGPAGFIRYEDRAQGIDRESLAFIKRLNLAMKMIEGEESAVGDFAVEVFRALGYETEQTVVRTHKSLRLGMCSEQVYARTDVFVQNIDSNILLLVQEDKSFISPLGPEAQLVAGMIAAFQANNANRHTNLFLPPLQSYVFLGVTMVGTFPRFYKMKVTCDLDSAIRAGQYPEVETVVERHTPRIPGRRNDGMRPLNNRLKILQCYEAFKRFIFQQEGDGTVKELCEEAHSRKETGQGKIHRPNVTFHTDVE